jgi:cell division protein FtsN
MKKQRGGTILGFIIGVVVGLAAALGVAVYVTKVPVPFMNKGQTRSADQDAEEAKKNKDWNPNAPLYGKNPAKPPQPAASADAGVATPSVAAPKPGDNKPTEAKAPDPKAPESKKPEAKAAASPDPIAELARAKAAATDPELFVYWVQVGAYRTAEDAESQRAKLSLGGIETKISEREQSGRMVYRVRVGPFDKKEDGEKSKEKLDKVGLETALVRVQR